MAQQHTEEFRAEAVRLALTSGLSRKQVSEGLGIGFSTLSRRTYGRPRMVEELKDMGFVVGHRRVGRLMRDNNIKAVRTREYKATTNSKHGFAMPVGQRITLS